jgi:hypothetical protein
MPGTTFKLLFFRVTLAPSAGESSATITLSGGAAFATGADVAVVCSGVTDATAFAAIAHITGAQTIALKAIGNYTSDAAPVLNVMIQGH